MSPNEPDGIEDALRRELKSHLVPFDGDRADEMLRSAASASPAGRGWVAPLAAAAVVVVVGGGVALATARGGDGSSAGGPALGPGATTSGDNRAADECAPMSGGAVGRIVVGTASAGPGSPAGHYTAYPVETATAEAVKGSPTTSPTPVNEPPSSTPASPPPPDATVDAESGAGSGQPVYELPTVDPSAVPALAPSDTIVICAVGTAGSVVLPSDGCTANGNRLVCVGSGDCTGPSTASDGNVICIATDTPLESGGSLGTCDPADACASGTTASGSEAFTVAATVPAGESRTFRGPDIPAGKNLLVRALVFQNQAADTGTVTVQRGGEDLLHEGLADFRDLDVRFDNEPLVFDADHPVRVTVDCTNANADCTPSVLFDGKYVQVQN